MEHLIDLSAYPLDAPDSAAFADLVDDCKARLARDGLFNLPGFVLPQATAQLVTELGPKFASDSFTHARRHNIYYKRDIPGLAPDHAALVEMQTVNHTLCADQLANTWLNTLYLWAPFSTFLAAVMDKPVLHPMDDPLAGVNAMAYHAGEALNWHFDRSEFTTTLLLQAPSLGGAFEYAQDLRSAEDPNYDGVAELLAGALQPQQMTLAPGTLNVFRGRNTAHRVTPVEGETSRMIALFSYFDRPGVKFTASERIGFYGRDS